MFVFILDAVFLFRGFFFVFECLFILFFCAWIFFLSRCVRGLFIFYWIICVLFGVVYTLFIFLFFAVRMLSNKNKNKKAPDYKGAFYLSANNQY